MTWQAINSTENRPNMSTSSSIFEYLYTNVGSPLHQPFMSLLNTLKLRQELHYTEGDSNLVSHQVWQRACMHQLSPLFTLTQSGARQFSLHVYIARYASEVLPPWTLQLLLLMVYNRWTGLLDSPKIVQNALSSLFQCRREVNHAYSAYFFAKFAPLARWGNFTAPLLESVEVRVHVNLQQKIRRAVILI